MFCFLKCIEVEKCCIVYFVYNFSSFVNCCEVYLNVYYIIINILYLILGLRDYKLYMECLRFFGVDNCFVFCRKIVGKFLVEVIVVFNVVI